jgi:PAS domain S-box-containing protein
MATADHLQPKPPGGDNRLEIPRRPSWADAAARVETDRAGIIIAWNGVAEALYGYSEREVVGRPIISVIVPVRARRQAAAIMEAVAVGRSWEGEFDVRHRDGHLVRVLVHDAPAYNADGEMTGVVGYSEPAHAARRPTASSSAQRRWSRTLSVMLVEPSAGVGPRVRLQLIALGLGLELVWDGLMRALGVQDAVGIAGAVALLGILVIAVADTAAGVAVALISGAFFTIAVAPGGAPDSFGYDLALIAVWVATALGAGVAAVRLRAQAQRGAAEAVSLHRELVGLLVPSPRLHRVDVSVAAVYRPGEQRLELGGDFYAAAERADGSIALLVGDVSGHGPAAAALGAMLRAAWEGLVEADVAPQVRLQTLNHLLLEHASHEEFFATVCSVVMDANLAAATITLAGHPPPILSHSGATLDLDLPTGVPLGVSDPAVWQPRRVVLPPEFSLLLYTDGIIEGRANGPTGERFGEERLIQAFTRSTATGRELLNDIFLAAESAHGGPLPDDAALLLLEDHRANTPQLACLPRPSDGRGAIRCTKPRNLSELAE